MGTYSTGLGLLGGADALQQMVAQQKFAQYEAQLEAAKQHQQDFENQVKAQTAQADAFQKYASGTKDLSPASEDLMQVNTVDAAGKPVIRLVGKSSGKAIGADLPQAPKELPAALQEAKPFKINGSGQVAMLVADPSSPAGFRDSNGIHYGSSEITPYQAPVQEAPGVAALRKAETDKLLREADQSTQGGSLGVDPGAVQGLHGDSYLQTLNPAQAAKIKALSEGRLAFPTSRAMSQPLIQQLINQVAQYDPTFDAVNFQARQKQRENFTSGTAGQQVNALNTAIGHLSDLSQSADALNNTSFTPVNAVKNYIAGKTGDPAITNFKANVQPVVEELTKVWRGTGGSEQDIQARLATLDSSNSPEQIHGAIAKIGHLLQSKIDALQSQYQQGMGTADIQMLTPASQKMLDILDQKANGGNASGASGGAAKVGDIRLINGKPAKWDGAGWVAIGGGL